MTNAEKFKEVFGFKPKTNVCIISETMCRKARERQKLYSCGYCDLKDWWGKQYRSCFCEDDRK